MAQFDVHRNLGPSRSTIPYLVIVQSVQFNLYRRRVVVPLQLKKSLPSELVKARSRTNPLFVIERQEVVLHVLDIASVDADKLGAFVLSLKEEGLAISDALDELFSRTWG